MSEESIVTIHDALILLMNMNLYVISHNPKGELTECAEKVLKRAEIALSQFENIVRSL